MIQLASRVILGTNAQDRSGSLDRTRSGSETNRYRASLSLSGSSATAVTRSWFRVGVVLRADVYSRSTR